jgi:hypothetical protein
MVVMFATFYYHDYDNSGDNQAGHDNGPDTLVSSA